MARDRGTERGRWPGARGKRCPARTQAGVGVARKVERTVAMQTNVDADADARRKWATGSGTQCERWKPTELLMGGLAVQRNCELWTVAERCGGANYVSAAERW